MNNKPELDLDNCLAEELKLLEEEFKNLTNFEKDTMDFFNNIAGAKGQRPQLGFIERQTANIISLKSNKINIIKEKANLKKIQIELANKFKSEDESGDGNVNINLNAVKAIIDLATKAPSAEKSKVTKETLNTISSDSDLDNDILKRIEEEKAKKKLEEEAKK